VINNTVNVGASTKTDFHIGIFSELRSNSVAFQPEIIYSRQGCETDYNFYAYYNRGNTKINLSYLNIPLLLKVYVIKGLNIHAGIQPGLLLAANEKGEITEHESGLGGPRPTSKSIDKDVKKDYKSTDFGIPIGLGYNFSSKFSASLRYTYGLTEVNNDAEITGYRERVGVGSEKMTNRIIQLSLGYSL